MNTCMQFNAAGFAVGRNGFVVGKKSQWSPSINQTSPTTKKQMLIRRRFCILQALNRLIIGTTHLDFSLDKYTGRRTRATGRSAARAAAGRR